MMTSCATQEYQLRVLDVEMGSFTPHFSEPTGYGSLMHLFIVLNRLLFLITHLNAQWNGTTGHY